jgi:hypothetical protein
MSALIAESFDRFPVDAGVDRHEVRTEFCLFSRDPEEVILFHVDDCAVFFHSLNESLVQRNTSDREGGVCNYLFSDLGKIAAGRELHESIGARTLGLFCFLDFLRNIDNIGGSPDGCIHFRAEALADTADLDVTVRGDRDDDVPLGYTAPDKVLGDSFLCRNPFHLIRGDAALGISNNTHAYLVSQKSR